VIKRTKEELTTCYLLRQAFSRSCLYWGTLKKAKKGQNQYECAKCHKIFKLREVKVDHILPVIEPERGWVNITTFACRLFCDPSNLWVLCEDTCHQKKTNKENKKRRNNA
jgi:5-methylcytosine-specific restriction endonuclease McrA